MASKGLEVVGMAEMKRAFNLLPRAVERKVMLGAVGAAIRPILKSAKDMAPEDLGHLKRNLATKKKHLFHKSLTYGVVGARNRWIEVPKSVRWTKTGKVNPALYAHLTGGDKGKTATGWFERAFRSAVPISKERFWKVFERGLNREAVRLGFKRRAA